MFAMYIKHFEERVRIVSENVFIFHSKRKLKVTAAQGQVRVML